MLHVKALDAFLGARRAYVTGALQGAAAAGQLPLEDLSGKLADAVAQMQATHCSSEMALPCYCAFLASFRRGPHHAQGVKCM